MALYAADLRERGHAVRCILVSPAALESLPARTCSPPPSWVFIDSIFPLSLAARVGALFPGARVVVGGHNAAQHVLHGAVELGVVGNGRKVVHALVEGVPWEKIPGCLGRNEDGALHSGPLPVRSDTVWDEVFPYRPFLDWEYLGEDRGPLSSGNAPSVVAESGCVYEAPLSRASEFADVPPLPIPVPCTPAATLLLQETLWKKARGCSFCTFRYQPLQRARVEETVGRVIGQIRFLVVERGVESVSLQSEHPFPLLSPLLKRLGEEDIFLKELRIRGIPWGILKEEETLRRALTEAGNTRIVLQQVGFEAFTDQELGLYHKGISAIDNRRCARLLTRLSAEWGADRFVGTRGHGLILFHPWTTVSTLKANLEAVRADAPFFLPSLGPHRRLAFYGDWLPILWKAHQEGLTVPGGDFGWDFRFRDPDVHRLDAALRRLLLLLERLSGPPAGASPSLQQAWRQKARGIHRQERPRLFAEALEVVAENPLDVPAQAQGFQRLSEALSGRFGGKGRE